MQTTVLSLLALAAGALSMPSAPAPSQPFTCTDATKGFAWSMKGFEFNASEINTTPSHVNTNGELAFNISNPGLTSVQPSSACSAHSVQYPSYFYGNIIYECSDPVSDTETKTTFSFDATANLLSINQTWTCPNMTYPITFFTSGSVNLTLETTSVNYTNSNWTLGQIFSSKSRYSTAKDGPITVFQIGAIA